MSYKIGNDLSAALTKIGWHAVHFGHQPGSICWGVLIADDKEMFELGHSLAYYNRELTIPPMLIEECGGGKLVFWPDAKVEA